MKRFLLRLKLAWYAFNLKDFEIRLGEYKIVEEIIPGQERMCNGCKKYMAINCISDTTIKLSVTDEDHRHLCKACSRIVLMNIHNPAKKE